MSGSREANTAQIVMRQDGLMTRSKTGRQEARQQVELVPIGKARRSRGDLGECDKKGSRVEMVGAVEPYSRQGCSTGRRCRSSEHCGYARAFR